MHTFTLLLAPFVSKLVDYLRRSESLKNTWKSTNCPFRWKMSSISNRLGYLQMHCASNNLPIRTPKVPKEAYICGLQTSFTNFKKYRNVHKLEAVKNSLITYYVCYTSMVYLERYCMFDNIFCPMSKPFELILDLY